MTKEQFLSLSPSAQEQFLNEGGVITSTPSPETQVECKVVDKDVPCNDSEFNKDSTESSQQPQPETLSFSQIQLDGLDIANPVELLWLLDDDVQSGRLVLHPWQIQFMTDFAEGERTDDFPFQAVVRAANGSGKDKIVIAACATWICMTHRETTCPITSASGFQLDNQTCRHIKRLCEAANRKWGKGAGFDSDIWKINYRNYLCNVTSSEMLCYATDEAGKAEGFHPLTVGKKLAVFVSEDKSVPDDINVAINKYTGYTHRVHASTPGDIVGHFFEMDSIAVPRESLKSVMEVNPTDYIRYHIPASKCPHLKKSYIEQMKRDLPGGENGAAYKSQVDAEFASGESQVVIPYTYIWRAKNKKLEDWIKEPYNKAGLDLSAGGDETVLVVRNGNRVLKVIPFKFEDTEDTKEFLIEQFKENNLTHKDALIFADCGGIGKPMLDSLRRLKWSNIRYCDNRAKSNRPTVYKNWGAQSWFNLRNLFEYSEIIIIDDQKLIKQLAGRYYKLVDGRVHQLLSKQEQKSKGYPSPDRGDALVLSFSDFKTEFKEPSDREAPQEAQREDADDMTVKSEFNLQSYAKGEYERPMSMNEKYNINGGVKKFTELEELVNEYNQQLYLAKQ